jgi:hypothetical protein
MVPGIISRVVSTTARQTQSVLLNFVKQAQNKIRRKKTKGKKVLNLVGRFQSIVTTLVNYRKHHDRRSFISKPLDLSERYGLGLYSESHQGVYGDLIFNRIMSTLNEFNSGGEPLILRPDQQIMVSYIMCSFLPFIYRDTLEANKARILKLLKIDKIREELIIMAARRVGKTTCIAVVVAAIMIVIPNSTGAIFSLALRASKRLMVMIRNTLQKHPKGAEMIKNALVDNHEQLVLQGDHPSHVKVLNAFPDKVDVCCLFLFFYLYVLLQFSFNIFETKQSVKPFQNGFA